MGIFGLKVRPFKKRKTAKAKCQCEAVFCVADSVGANAYGDSRNIFHRARAIVEDAKFGRQNEVRIWLIAIGAFGVFMTLIMIGISSVVELACIGLLSGITIAIGVWLFKRPIPRDAQTSGCDPELEQCSQCRQLKSFHHVEHSIARDKSNSFNDILFGALDSSFFKWWDEDTVWDVYGICLACDSVECCVNSCQMRATTIRRHAFSVVCKGNSLSNELIGWITINPVYAFFRHFAEATLRNDNCFCDAHAAEYDAGRRFVKKPLCRLKAKSFTVRSNKFRGVYIDQSCVRTDDSM